MSIDLVAVVSLEPAVAGLGPGLVPLTAVRAVMPAVVAALRAREGDTWGEVMSEPSELARHIIGGFLNVLSGFAAQLNLRVELRIVGPRHPKGRNQTGPTPG